MGAHASAMTIQTMLMYGLRLKNLNSCMMPTSTHMASKLTEARKAAARPCRSVYGCGGTTAHSSGALRASRMKTSRAEKVAPKRTTRMRRRMFHTLARLTWASPARRRRVTSQGDTEGGGTRGEDAPAPSGRSICFSISSSSSFAFCSCFAASSSSPLPLALLASERCSSAASCTAGKGAVRTPVGHSGGGRCGGERGHVPCCAS